MALVIDNRPAVRILRDPSNELLVSKEWAVGSGLALVFITSGAISLDVGYAHYSVTSQHVLILLDSLIINGIEASSDFKGYLIAFDLEFMDRIHASGMMPWIGTGAPSIIRKSNDDAKRYKSFITLLSDSLADPRQRNEEISQLLSRAFVLAVLEQDFETLDPEDGPRSRGDVIAGRFIHLVRQYGVAHRDLEFYADILCITPKYLSRVVSKNTGKKALKWIEDFIMDRVMYKLRTTDLNVNQISDELNFFSTSDFCRVFRKNTGMTPLDYRKSNS